MKTSPFGLSLGEPLAKALLHGLPAVPAANVDCRDDLERLKPLDEPFQLQKAAVLAVRDACEDSRKGRLGYSPVFFQLPRRGATRREQPF